MAKMITESSMMEPRRSENNSDNRKYSETISARIIMSMDRIFFIMNAWPEMVALQVLRGWVWQYLQIEPCLKQLPFTTVL